MRIPLSSFEQHIDETILERGLKYFESGAVGEVEQISPGEFEAEVEGSETYVVRITVRQGNVEEHECDCPYDGPVCKHVVAVLFHLEQEELDLKVKRKRSKKKDAGSAKRKPTTVLEKVADLVDSMAHEELKDFILMRCAQDKELRRIIMDAYEERKGSTTHAGYAKRIRATISANGGRGRANGWYAAKPVSQALEPMRDKLKGFMADGSHALALPLATALLNELNKALEHIDDSSGYLSGDLETAIEALHSISEAPADEHVRKELLAFAIAALRDGRYAGWDWHSGLMAICARLVRSEEEAAPVLNALQANQSSSFANNRAREHEMEIIRRLRGDAAADEYMNAHLDVADIRENAIETAIAQKHFDRAWQLATEGYEKDRVKLPGLAAQWVRAQIRIAGLRGQKELVVRLARTQVLACNNAPENLRLLEKFLGAERWPEEREHLLQELLKYPGWQQRQAAADLLASLERWKDLLVLSRAEENGSIFNQHVDVLAKHFPREVAKVHLEKADALLGGWNPSRRVYMQACELLKRVVAMDLPDLVEGKVEEWRKTYANRPSLLEEIGIALGELPAKEKKKGRSGYTHRWY
jgi:uncharacterized Zn finger protein